MNTDWLPFSELPSVRERANELFSREMLGAVLVGKFVGDYAAILAVGALGQHLGYGLGIIVTIGLFVYWERVAQRAKAAADEYSGTQRSLSDYSGE